MENNLNTSKRFVSVMLTACLLMISFVAASSVSFAQQRSDVIDVILVMDESGSMTGNDINRISIDAALLVPYIANSHDRIAVVGFGEYAHKVVPLKAIKSNKQGIIDGIKGLVWDDQHSMIKEGLLKAEEEYARIPRDREVRAVIVLSDGRFRGDLGDFPKNTDIDVYKEQLREVSRRFGSNKIPIFTIAFTNEANIDWLSDIAALSGGASYKAEKPEDIQKVMDKIRGWRGWFCNDCDSEEKVIRVTLTKDKYHEIDVTVPPGVSQLVVRATKINVNSPSPEIVIMNPDGAQAQSETITTNSYTLSKLNNPEPGKWKIKVRGEGEVIISLIEKLDIDLRILKPATEMVGTPKNGAIEVAVALLSGDSLVDLDSVNIKVFVKTPENPNQLKEIKINDSGAGPDEIAGDRVFSGLLEKVKSEGKYAVVVEATLKNTDPRMGREVRKDFIVKFESAKADLDILEPASNSNSYELNPGLSIPVQVIITPVNTSLRPRDLDVKATLKTPTGIRTITLGDSGTGGDKKAGDLVFSANLTGINDIGKHTIIATAYMANDSGNELDSGTRDFFVERGKIDCNSLPERIALELESDLTAKSPIIVLPRISNLGNLTEVDGTVEVTTPKGKKRTIKVSDGEDEQEEITGSTPGDQVYSGVLEGKKTGEKGAYEIEAIFHFTTDRGSCVKTARAKTHKIVAIPKHSIKPRTGGETQVDLGIKYYGKDTLQLGEAKLNDECSVLNAKFQAGYELLPEKNNGIGFSVDPTSTGNFDCVVRFSVSGGDISGELAVPFKAKARKPVCIVCIIVAVGAAAVVVFLIFAFKVMGSKFPPGATLYDVDTDMPYSLDAVKLNFFKKAATVGFGCDIDIMDAMKNSFSIKPVSEMSIEVIPGGCDIVMDGQPIVGSTIITPDGRFSVVDNKNQETNKNFEFKTM